jgi:ABC-type iron transport system FetAB permease component
MSIVPRHFMGRTQSAIAVVTTVLQLLMSFALGWIAQRISLFAGFALLGLMYSGAGAFATRARQLLTEGS